LPHHKQEPPMAAGHISCMICTIYGNFVQYLPNIIPTSNNLLCLLVSEEKIFKISANQKQELTIATMFFVQ